MKRRKLGRRESKTVFRRTAGTAVKNFGGSKSVMRGGIRL